MATKKKKLADPPNKNDAGIQHVSLRDLDDEFAPNKDKPTTADAKKGLLDLPSVVASVDPQGLSSLAPMMFPMLGQIKAASSGSSQSSRKVTMEETLADALAILSNKYTFDNLTTVFDNALKNDNINLIDAEYREVLKNALARLYLNYSTYGEGNLAVATFDTVTTIGTAPTPVLTTVPDLYVKQYYAKDLDPYPGYVHWVSPDGTASVFTQRQLGELYYATPTEEVFSSIEIWLADSLEPYVVANNLTAQVLNTLLNEADNKIDQESQEATGGKNSSSQLMSILMQLAGYIGSITNKQQSTQLPFSVLNKGSIASSHQSFLKNMGQIKKEKELAKIASQPASALSSLGQVAGLAGSAKNLYDTIKG